MILEPIQGEGGRDRPRDDYLPGVRALCDGSGALLILDEMQTGHGPHRRMFACDHWDVTPDIMCLAKAFGGGVMPAGAVIARRPSVARVSFDNPFLHSTTFGGNPLACRAAIAAINVTTRRTPGARRRMGEYMLAGLRDAVSGHEDVVRDVRGKGLMIALEFADDATGFRDRQAHVRPRRPGRGDAGQRAGDPRRTAARDSRGPRPTACSRRWRSAARNAPRRARPARYWPSDCPTVTYRGSPP